MLRVAVRALPVAKQNTYKYLQISIFNENIPILGVGGLPSDEVLINFFAKAHVAIVKRRL